MNAPSCSSVRLQASLALLFGKSVENLSEEIRLHLRGCVMCRLRAGFVRGAIREAKDEAGTIPGRRAT